MKTAEDATARRRDLRFLPPRVVRVPISWAQV